MGLPEYQQQQGGERARGLPLFAAELTRGATKSSPPLIATSGNCWAEGCADITYLPMRRGFLYLVAIINWNNHKFLA